MNNNKPKSKNKRKLSEKAGTIPQMKRISQMLKLKYGAL
jgi:hypothetical protein